MKPRTLRLERLEDRSVYDASALESPSSSDAAIAELQHELLLPPEIQHLMREAVALSQNGPEWRAPELGETSMTTMRKGALLSLRATDALTVGVTAQVAAAAPVTAHVYRGTELLAAMPVAAGGGFQFQDEDGITDVLFTTNVVTGVSATNLSILTDEGFGTLTAGALAPMNSKPYALANAKDLQQPASFSHTHYLFDYTTSASSNGGSGVQRIMIERDPSQFTLIRNQQRGGWSRIAGVRTIKQAGVDYRGRTLIDMADIQDGYAYQIDENTVLLAPGTPPKTVITMGQSNAYFTLQMTHGASIEQLLPPAKMSAATVDASIILMNDQHQTEGIFTPFTEVREGSSPTFSRPGDIANVQYHVRNNALSGGAVRMDVYAGWYANEPARGTLQDSFNLSMGGGYTTRVSVNVTAPGKPADATSERPIISAVLRLPDGTTVENAKLGKEPRSREKRVYTRNEDGTTTMHVESDQYTTREQARIRELTDRALMALLSSSDGRLQTIRGTLGDDRIVQLLAQNAQVAFTVSESVSGAESVDAAMAEVAHIIPLSVNAQYVDVLDDPAYAALLANTTIHDNVRLLKDFGKQTYFRAEWPTEGYSTKTVRFELTQDSMVNLSLSETPGTLSITRNGIPLFSASREDPFSGKSISACMDAGTYEVRVVPALHVTPELVPVPRTPKLRVEVEPFDGKIVNGRISRENDHEVMNVKLQKIGISNGQIDNDRSNLNAIDPTVPTWIYIHGREDRMDGDNMSYLANSLQGTGEQVIALDWNESAADNDLQPLLGADWIPSVAKWAANQLKMLGFNGENIRLVGHSWGSFVSHDIARLLKNENGFGVDRLVALDSAKDSAMLNNYSASSVNFSDVSNLSLALRSSAFGSDGRANSADYNFELISPLEARQLELINGIVESTREDIITLPLAAGALATKWIDDRLSAFYNEHGFAVSAFASALLRKGDIVFQDILQNFVDGDLVGILAIDRDNPEGVILLNAEKDESKDDWWYAIPHTTV